ERARIDEQLRCARSRVERPEIELILRVGFSLQVSHVTPIGGELRFPQPRAAQIRCRKDAFDGEGLRSNERSRKRSEEQNSERCIPHGPCVQMKLQRRSDECSMHAPARGDESARVGAQTCGRQKEDPSCARTPQRLREKPSMYRI